ncbi:MAG TPA: GNAT family N-acetyltransferase [Egibacteraceae bacterium]|nr:GNAT family N-acetyltransferase [Egibacteraceae bacterium]
MAEVRRLGEHDAVVPTYRWRGEMSDRELFELTEAHGGRAAAGWWDKIRPHSLGWVTARGPDGVLIGFVHVAWDGSDHAFILDPKVRPDHQHHGIGTRLVRIAADHAKQAGCEWLHVDFDDELAPFYLQACGFKRTAAGLLALASPP